MKINKSAAGLVAAVISLTLFHSAQGQIVTYTFGTTGSPVISGTTAANLSTSDFSSLLGDGAPGTATGSSTAGGSGGAYFTASNWRDSDSNYFYFTLTPENGYSISITGLSFYYAATSTGPTSATFTASNNSYGSPLVSLVLTPRSSVGSITAADWHLASTASITLSGITTTTTFRINASGASGSTGSLRIDDVTLLGTVTAIPAAVPEPSTYAAILGGVALVGVVAIRRRKRVTVA